MKIEREIYRGEYGDYKVIMKGELLGKKYAITTNGIAPCAYIEYDGKSEDLELEKVPCHCGITFEGRRKFDDYEKNYLGWDYGHSGDYITQPIPMFGLEVGTKKWTVEEIFKDIVEMYKFLYTDQFKGTKKEIEMWKVNKIKNYRLRIFEAEDSDCPNWYSVRANDRQIERLIKDYTEEEKQELRSNIDWCNNNCVGSLERLGWKITRKKKE